MAKKIRVREFRTFEFGGFGGGPPVTEARVIEMDEDKVTTSMEKVPETTELCDWYNTQQVGT